MVHILRVIRFVRRSRAKDFGARAEPGFFAESRSRAGGVRHHLDGLSLEPWQQMPTVNEALVEAGIR